MNVVYKDRAKQAGERFELLQEATGRLKEILGAAQDSVDAQWDQIEDGRGRSLYSLKISDFAGEAEAAFTPDELRKGTHVDFQLARLCNELLRIRGHKLMEALREPFDTEENGHASEPE